MFKVKGKLTGEEFVVYAVAGTMFLVYACSEEYTGWRYVDMDEYEPVGGER